MFTRLWQFRYHGLIATILIGLSAAVIVMLLPDRQQAVARLAMNPAAVAMLAGAERSGSTAILDNEYIIQKVLQRLQIDRPNPVDPRPVDPVDAYKRNFALLPAGTEGEFELRYVARSADNAIEGIDTWLQAAREVLQQARPAEVEAPAEPVTATADVDKTELTALEKAAEDAASNLELATAADRSANDAVTRLLAELDQARDDLQLRERALADAREAGAARERERELERAAEQSQREARRTALERDRADLQQTAREQDQRTATLERELAGVEQRVIASRNRVQNTPATLAAVVEASAPPSAASRDLQDRLAQAKQELARLQIRFTDNHPDVRRQLAIIDELEQRLGAAPTETVSRRTVERPNPERAQAEQALASVQSEAAALRAQLEASRRARRETAGRLQALESQSGAAAPESRDPVARRTALNGSEAQLVQARAAARGAIGRLERELDDAQADSLTARESLQAARSAAEQADAALRQARAGAGAGAAVPAGPAGTSPAGTSVANASPASARLVVLADPQVMPAAGNANRPYWLWMSLLGSLLVGALTTILASLRPSGIYSVADLEKVTGLRALGAVPRFRSSARTMGRLFGLMVFVLLLLAYILLYIGFIGMVDSGISWRAPDWLILQDWARDLFDRVAARLDLSALKTGEAGTNSGR